MDITQFEDIRLRASRLVDDAADELAQRYGFDSFNISVREAMVDIATADLIALRALKGLGDTQTLAFSMPRAEAMLAKKLSRRLFSVAQDAYESASAGQARHESPDANVIENSFRVWRASDSEEVKQDLVRHTSQLVQWARKNSRDALDRFGDAGDAEFTDARRRRF